MLISGRSEMPSDLRVSYVVYTFCPLTKSCLRYEQLLRISSLVSLLGQCVVYLVRQLWRKSAIDGTGCRVVCWVQMPALAG